MHTEIFEIGKQVILTSREVDESFPDWNITLIRDKVSVCEPKVDQLEFDD